MCSGGSNTAKLPPRKKSCGYRQSGTRWVSVGDVCTLSTPEPPILANF